MKIARSLVASALLVVAACSEDDASVNPPIVQVDMPIVGPKVRLGMNPTLQPDVPTNDWPAAGSSTSLYMARLWDMGVTWAQIEPSPPVDGVHNYDWHRMDDRMAQIIAADMRPMIVLYGTPEWAAPGCQVNYTGACPVYPVDPENWSAFVSAVAARYINHRTTRGETPVYEVWNEPNLDGSGDDPNEIAYWTGSDEQLLDLNRRAWEAIKAVAPGEVGTVVCCGWNRRAANLSTSDVDAWLEAGGGSYVDAISYHPYPKNWDPSTAAEFTGKFRAAMARHDVVKPLWATEVGFINGLFDEGKPEDEKQGRALSHAEQAQLVSNTILTLRAQSVPVVLWYLWNESHVGYADSDFVGLHRVVAEALAAAGSDPNAPQPAACDEATQPAPQWDVKEGQCLPACGIIGGTSAFITPCALHGMIDVGRAYDVDYCCTDNPLGACDPATQPSPQWGMKNGLCLAACGVVGGSAAFTTPCEQNGMVDAGPAYDVDYCCWEPAQPSPLCDASTQPYPQWGEKDGQCLPACGVIGGTSAFTTPCDQNGKVDVGLAYDVDYCCTNPTSSCDPSTQPYPQWDVKNGQCLPACGVIGGTSAFTTPCAQNGKVDAGLAYDVAYCCKDPPPVCDPVTQPYPSWGEKDGQCLQACGLIGGTSAFTTPCDQNGKVDAGPAYDVAYCCKEPGPVCDPVTQPYPNWGEKDGQCLQACGLIGGTSAFTTPCDQNGKVDAGQAYDVAYCCKDPPPVCDPVTQPYPNWGEKDGLCLPACGLIGGTAAFEEPCGAHGMADAGAAYDVTYCCK